MAQPTRPLLYWAPRALGVLSAVFLSLFALDVFGQGYGPWQTVLALLLHLIPTGLLAIALAIAWRWEWAGAIIFIGLGLAYLAVAIASAGIVSAVVVPLFLIGGLFLAAWLSGRPRRAT